jgi:hypothetical protein
LKDINEENYAQVINAIKTRQDYLFLYEIDNNVLKLYFYFSKDYSERKTMVEFNINDGKRTEYFDLWKFNLVDDDMLITQEYYLKESLTNKLITAELQ